MNTPDTIELPDSLSEDEQILHEVAVRRIDTFVTSGIKAEKALAQLESAVAMAGSAVLFPNGQNVPPRKVQEVSLYEEAIASLKDVPTTTPLSPVDEITAYVLSQYEDMPANPYEGIK